MRYGPGLLPALLLLVPCGARAQGDVATKTQPMANQISCPVSELKYGFAQSFPDPWYGTETVESEPVLVGAAFTNGPFSATVAGNPMLVCRWKGYGNTAALFVARPMVNMPVASYPCPPQLQVKVLTSLPAPWVGTTYSWSLTEKGTSETLPQYSSTLPNSNFCVYSGTTPLEILYPLPVTAQKGMTGLAAAPPPKIDQLAQNFLVTKAQLTATPASGSASCPTTVRFDASIATNGPGNVVYRREINGQAGSLQMVNFTAAGEKIVSFETQVAPPQQGSGPTLTTQAQASNVVNGQARVIIQSPEGVSASNVASYRISCTTVSPAGSLKAAVPPGAAPARTAPARVASGVRPRTVMRGGRIPVRVADGRSGWVLFNLSGQPGGPASGSITLLLAAPGSPAVTTEYQVSAGTFSQNQSDYEFIMQGTARKPGGSSRHFSSRLKLVGSARSGEQTMVADDVWVVDGLTCQKSGNELICT